MSSDKNLEELYKSTFREVHASDELKGMVEKMADNKKVMWKRLCKRAATVAAVVAVAFATGNFATYAATGENLISFVDVKINGKKVDLKKDMNMEKKVDEDGRTYYQGKIKDKNGDVEMKLYDDTESSIKVEGGVDAEVSIEVGETETVNTENGTEESSKEVEIK